MNTPKVNALREKLRERINVAIENGIVFGGDLDEIESICRQIELARKEPMPCKNCGKVPTEAIPGFTAGGIQYGIKCCGKWYCGHTPAQAIEQWDKEQQ